MNVRKYDGFVDRIDSLYAAGEAHMDLVTAMTAEIKELLIEFGQAYELEADPDKQVENCSESIMNLILETKYEW